MDKKELEKRMDLLYQMVKVQQKEIELYKQWFGKIRGFIEIQNRFDTELTSFVQSLDDDIEKLIERRESK